MAAQATKQELIAAIRRHIPDVEDGLYPVAASGRIMGFVVSSSFEQEDHEERQKRLWAAIEQAFSPEQQMDIGPIITMTPDEASLQVADGD